MSLDPSAWEKHIRGLLFVVTGSSGTGKTTLVKAVLASPRGGLGNPRPNP
jgi:guanylate kinase